MNGNKVSPEAPIKGCCRALASCCWVINSLLPVASVCWIDFCSFVPLIGGGSGGGLLKFNPLAFFSESTLV